MIKSNQPSSADFSINNKFGPLKGLSVYLLFLFICLVAYSGIAFLSYSLKWDMLDCYLPWRYYVGESIQNGVFPLWNPYQHLGYPIHADLRSVFYPEAILVGLLRGYSIYTLHFLFITYLSLAGFGMYMLARHFTAHQGAHVLAGIVYMLSGFFVSHGQEMFGIIAATWIPFILYYFIRLLKERQWPDVWKLGIFFFLQLTGGYQALSIMLLYLLILLFVAEIASLLYRRQFPDLKRLLILNTVLAGVVLVSMAVLIVTFVQVAGHIGRFGGTSLAEAQFMPFSPRSMISFLIPFASVKDTAYFDTDLSMNNAYTGLLMLMLYLLTWFRKLNGLERIFRYFGLVCLLAAFGKYTPVREWLYNYFPMMNLFRMSAFFRYYMMISVILLGAAEFGRLIENRSRFIKRLAVMIAIAAIAIGLFVLNAKQFVDFGSFRLQDFLFNLRNVLETSTRHEHIVFHGLIQLVLLVLLMVGLVIVKLRGKGLTNLLIVFTVLEMTLAVKLNFHVTVGSDHRPATIQNILRNMPEGFPVPDLHTPLKANRDMKPGLHPLWRNTNIYTKTISAEGFNSFRLDAFETLQRDYPALLEASLNNPPLFLSDEVKHIENFSPEFTSPGMLWLERITYDSIFSQIGSRQKTDTLILQKFDPGHIVCRAEITEPQVLTLMQARYTGWHVIINGEPVMHFTSNHLFISCLVPVGSHKVEFIYRNMPVMAAFLLSYAVFFLLILVIVFNFFISKHANRAALRLTLFVAILAVGAILLATTTIKKSDQKRLKSYKRITREISSLPVDPETTLLVLNVDYPPSMDDLLENSSKDIHYQRFSRKSDLVTFDDFLQQTAEGKNIVNLVYAFYNLPSGMEVEEIIRQYFPVKTSVKSSGKTNVTAFSKVGSREAIFSSFNDFEQAYPYWTGDPAKNDTTTRFSGNYSWRLDSAQPGSPALVATFGELGATDVTRIVASAQVLLTSGADAALYILIERDGKNLWQRSVCCLEMIEYPNQWTKILIAAEPDFQPLASDVLKVFFWINGNRELLVDDFSVRLFE